MKKIVIGCWLSVLSGYCLGQTVTYIDDSLNVKYLPIPNDPEIDSVIFANGWENTHSGLWKVYFDKTKKQLAFESFLNGDTSVKIDYWRNGKLKKKTLYINNGQGFYGWYYDEKFCSNGQLIYKGYINLPGKQEMIGYYCNGNKKFQFIEFGMFAEGPVTNWYEDGKKQSEMNYSKGIQQGESKYWDEKGNLTKTEIYKDGVLVETK